MYICSGRPPQYDQCVLYVILLVIPWASHITLVYGESNQQMFHIVANYHEAENSVHRLYKMDHFDDCLLSCMSNVVSCKSLYYNGTLKTCGFISEKSISSNLRSLIGTFSSNKKIIFYEKVSIVKFIIILTHICIRMGKYRSHSELMQLSLSGWATYLSYN